jgi:hypothetical protein
MFLETLLNITIPSLEGEFCWPLCLSEKYDEYKMYTDIKESFMINNSDFYFSYIVGIMKKVAHLRMSADMTTTILSYPVNSIGNYDHSQLPR